MEVTHRHHFVLSKIVATIGPASAEVETVVRLIEAGVRVFRINFSHGRLEDFQKLLKGIRKGAARTERYVGILGDLCGPKIRIGQIVDDGLLLKAGEILRLHPPTAELPDGFGRPGEVCLSLNRSDVIREVEVGHRVFLDDGLIHLRCVESQVQGDGLPSIACEVLNEGRVLSGKGVNLPDTELTMPSLTEWDAECVDFAVEAGFDFLALSFVRQADDVRALKDRLRKLGARPARPVTDRQAQRRHYSAYGSESRSFIPVVAKIEKPQAMDRLDEIVDEADMIMVARGDLGVEMDLAEVPLCQKQILRTCHHHGKPAIVATQMLQSMIDNPSPTRAEVTDVANAVYEGADAVMLSGETAVGKYPVDAVKYMRRIARHMNDYRLAERLTFEEPTRPRESKYRIAALAHAVKSLVKDTDAVLIVMWSQLGGGASYMAQNKLAVPIITLSSNEDALRRMSILYGVIPRYMEVPESIGDFVTRVDDYLLAKGWADRGDPIILVSGEPIGKEGRTNILRIHYVGDE